MRTFIENYLHFMKNCIRPHYEKLKPLKSGFIENSNFENNRDPCFRVRLTEIPSWGSPSMYGDVVSAAATEVGARELARGGERGLAKAPCLGPCIPCIPCIQAPCLGRKMLERCASTKYVHCTYIYLIIPLSVLELDGFFH